MKNFHGGVHRILKNPQIFVAFYYLSHFPSSNKLRIIISGEKSAACYPGS
jgi:hypothetical protein